MITELTAKKIARVYAEIEDATIIRIESLKLELGVMERELVQSNIDLAMLEKEAQKEMKGKRK